MSKTISLLFERFPIGVLLGIMLVVDVGEVLRFKPKSIGI